MENGGWTKKYSVNNELLDGQHKTLLSILGRMADFVETLQEPELMVHLLTEMSDYALEHFNSEELYMANIGFPHLDDHVEKHGNYSISVLKFTCNHLTDSPDAPENVFKYLLEWWTEHILLEDKKYALYAQQIAKK